MGHTHLSFVVEITQPSNSFKMYKLFAAIAAAVASANAEGYYPAGYAGYGGLYPAGLAGAYGAYGYGLAAPALAHGYAGYAAAPIAAAPIAAAPAVAAPAVVAPAPARYAVPAPRVIEEAPIVEKIVEPVEQWGYKIKY